MLLNFQNRDSFLLTLLLLGQPELKEKINQIKQLQQRIAVSCYLDRLTPQETSQYVEHRLGVAGADSSLFTDGAIQLISEHSGGVPRRINHICDLALVAGFSEGNRQINENTVLDVVKDLEL